MDSENPSRRASYQGEATASVDWDGSFRRIMALTAANPQKFASMPRANRFDAILEATVPSRKDPTHAKVLAIVNALVQNKAVRPDEAGGIYNALLERVGKYNSMNTQTNLDRLVQDVKEAVSQKERSNQAPSLASIVTLNSFYETLPANVPRGQSDYLAFLSALKMLVSEVPQTDVYQTGPNFYFSTTRNGSQTVNLTTAFENLKNLWGVAAPTGERSSISSILTPNTRLLLLIVAPFTDAVSINRDSYIGHLLTLYREAIGSTRLDEQTFAEVTDVSRALGQQDGQNLQATLNFLLTNNHKKLPKFYQLSREEERVLRYVQQSTALYLMQDNVGPAAALDLTSANMNPSFYARHRAFVNKLMDYLRRAAAISPNYFTNAILNSAWMPPDGFFTGDFEFPEHEDMAWDDTDNNMFARLRSMKEEGDENDDDARSLSELGAAAPPARTIHRAAFTPLFGSRQNSLEYMDAYKKTFVSKPKNEDVEMDSLMQRLNSWKTYRQSENDDDSLNGTGMFSHLRPKGVFV